MPPSHPFRLPRLGRILSAAGFLSLAACGVPGPDPRSDEYWTSWGLQAVNVQPAYESGASGQGITVAFVDCGIDGSPTDLAKRLSPRSIDLNPDRKIELVDRHANEVAAPLGAALDGRGLTGVAYNATLLSVRADFDGGWEGQCAFKSHDLARALDYVRDSGARIAVLPLVGRRPQSEEFEQALERLIAADIAVVIAAGNDSREQPSWPARYAADPRFAGGIIVAGAARADGTLAPWSNRAGSLHPYYIVAPGDHVITDCDMAFCSQASGTSLATPYVAGALALLMEARPRITSRQAIDILLRSARPIGAPEEAGRGNLDIGRAFQERRADLDPQKKAGGPV